MLVLFFKDQLSTIIITIELNCFISHNLTNSTTLWHFKNLGKIC